MTHRSLLIGAAAALFGGLLLSGCASAGAGKGRAQKGPGDPEEEMEKRVRSVAHFATGLSFDLNDKSEQALAEMVRAAETDPSSEAIVIDAAQRCIKAQKAELAVDLLTKSAAQSNASGAVYAWLGFAYAQSGKTELAIAANRTAIRKQPQSLAAYQNLAQVYLQTSRTNEALQVLNEAADQPSADAEFLLDLSELFLKLARVQSSQSEVLKKRVLGVLDRTAGLAPVNPIQILRMADAYFGIGELKKAEPFYRQLIEDHPDIPSLRGKLTEIYLRSGQKEKASEQLEALARNEPTNPQAYIFLGALAVDEKKYAEAADHFERALKLDPDLEQVYYDLAGLRLNLKKPEDALATLAKARSRFKLSFPLEFYTGVAYAAAKKYGDALTYLTSAEAIARATDPSRLNHLFYFQMGSTHERAGHLEEAEKYFRESLKISPDDPEALNYLGYMFAEQGKNLEEARGLIEKALRLQPDNAAFLDSLAWVLYKLNQPAEALPPLLKALEQSEEPDATLYDHLGDIYAGLKQFDRAKEAWGKSLKVEPNDQIERKLKEAPAEKPADP